MMDVVVGVDDSGRTELVLRAAIKEAQLRQAKLHVVHVMQMPTMWVDGMTAIPSNFMDVSVDLAEKMRGALWDRVRAVLADHPIDWVQIDRTGYPPDELVDYLKSIDASLVVVGSRGMGDLKSLLLGSTSHRVSHLSPCDVLIIKS
jgi:nucleotide-binding universal stress UspA family protein